MSSRPRSCFRQFFLGQYIPQYLEINFNNTPSSYLKYICQTRDNIFTVHYYASLFDEQYGVPVYSGYRISRSQGIRIDTISYRQRPSSSAWQKTPGECKFVLPINLRKLVAPQTLGRSRDRNHPNALERSHAGLAHSRVYTGRI